MDINELRQKHSNMHLHYHDNQSWTLFSQQPPEDAEPGTEEYDSLVLVQGDDYQDCDGYLPDLVADLCRALNITCDSI